ncbi:LysE family translocator [Chachezhania antarctica]|uniref:LysE family translocator n=1 Tax=Chachezhania antarctica TaxID=2340860 RepID=UPI000EAEA093|nr:LysE family translocator [Chachezhania antarctica]|tara:strand:+ start:2237 stop:2851 length:615 start_codon:yes stop_codon:yes gene_type:complete
MIGQFAAIAAAFFIVAVSPGPANLACAATAMAHGRAAGLRFAFGLSLGLALWGLCAATGLGALLAASQSALIVMKIAGASCLLYLAWLSARSAARPAAKASAPVAAGRAFRRGLLLNLSNPKAVLAWLAALSVGLGPDQGPGAVFGATGLCALIGLANYLGWAVLFSTAPAQALHTRFRAWIDGAVAVLYAGLGLGLLRSVITR